MLGTVALLATLMFTPWFDFFKAKQPQDVIHWRSVAEAETEGLATQRPLLFLFTADWCPPCVALKATVLSDTAVAELIEQNFVPVEVEDVLDENLRSQPEVERLKLKYLVSRLPTFVVTHANGGPAVSQEGRPVYSEVMRFLETARIRLDEAETRYKTGRRKSR